MSQNLIKLGASLPFKRTADFSGISNGLYISKAFHQAVVEVNEEGTEAAAATYVIMVPRSSREQIRTNMFICNRPFLFVIHDNANGGILFIGKYMKPSKNIININKNFKIILIFLCLTVFVFFVFYLLFKAHIHEKLFHNLRKTQKPLKAL